VDYSEMFADFYEKYMAAMDPDEGNGDCSSMAISEDFSKGIYALERALKARSGKLPFVKVQTTGRDSIDRRGPYIFMSNHLSFIDGPLLFLLIPQSVRVILKKEVFRIPVVGQGMRFVGFVPVDRKGVRGGRKSIERAVHLMRERGYSYLIFPEGTRTRDGRTQAFRRGGFFLALESGAAIVPVTIHGTYELMPRGTIFPRRGKVDVRFHSPVSLEGYDQHNMQTLIDKVKETIVSGLPA